MGARKGHRAGCKPHRSAGSREKRKRIAGGSGEARRALEENSVRIVTTVAAGALAGDRSRHFWARCVCRLPVKLEIYAVWAPRRPTVEEDSGESERAHGCAGDWPGR